MNKSLKAWLLVIAIVAGCKSSRVVTDIREGGSSVDLSSLNLQSPWTDFKGSETRSFDLAHVSVSLKLDLEDPSLCGEAMLVLTPYYYDQEILFLDAKGLEIDSLSIDDTVWFDYEYDGNQITITLPHVYEKGEQCVVRVYYSTGGFNIPAQVAGNNSGGICIVNYWPDRPQQIWTQGETDYTSNWYPTLGQPNERYTQKVSIKVPDTLQTLSNGELTSQLIGEQGWRVDTWQLDKPHAPYLSALVIGQFEKYELKNSSVKGSIYLEKGADSTIADLFDRTGEMIDLFEDRFGIPYQWPVYNQIVVRDFVSGAMENTGAVIFMENLMIDQSAQKMEHYDNYISHELAHHWFGNLVTCESWSNLALNESFAQYSEQIWNEYYYGQDSADLIGFTELYDYLDESLHKKEDLIRYYYQHADADLFDNHSYAKGSRILHMLRLFVGDEAFFESIRFYLTANKFSSVEVHDLRLAFEEVTGLDLNWFFTQWFLNPGHPELDVVHFSQNDTLYIEVEQLQDLLEYPLYRLPLYVDVMWGGETLSYPLTVENKRHVFRIPAMGRKVKAIMFDSDYQLVGTINHKKTPDELIVQALNAEQVIARYEAYLRLLEEDQEPGISHKAIKVILDERHPMLLTKMLDKLSYLEADILKDHEVDILKLCKSESIHIRSSALQLVGKFFSDKMKWDSLLNDQHPYIVGIALENKLLTSEKTQRLDLLESYESSDEIDIVLPLTLVINNDIKQGYGNWYQQKIMQLLASNQYYLLSAYNKYLLTAPERELVQAKDFLIRYAKYHQDSETRVTAFEGLVILSKKMDLGAVLADVVDFEQDYQLQGIYLKFIH